MDIRIGTVPTWALTTLGVCMLLLVWVFASSGEAARLGLVPTPWATLLALLELLGSVAFWNDLTVTLYRMMFGFTVSVMVGLPLGVGIGLSRTLSATFGGIVDSFKYTPVSAFIPLSIIFFGVGDAQKAAIILLGTGPYMAAMASEAVRGVRAEHVEGALTLGASRTQVILCVVLPSAAPQMWHAARLALGIAWTYMLTAELVGADHGLGRFLLRAARFVNTDQLLAGVVVIAIIGWLSDLLFRVVYARRFRWAVLLSDRQNGDD